MKQIVCFSILALLLFSCRKEIGVCKDYKEEKGRTAGQDPANLNYQPFRDTLDKYPQLHLINYWNNTSYQSMFCEVYYDELPVLPNGYSLSRNANGQVTQSGQIIRSLSISLEPEVSLADAVKEAKKRVNLDYACIRYRKVIFDRTWGSGNPDYRLAWKIMDADNPYVFAILDAKDKKYYQGSGGGGWVY